MEQSTEESGNTSANCCLLILCCSVQEHDAASFAAGEAQLPGGCGSVDPEVPVCNVLTASASKPSGLAQSTQWSGLRTKHYPQRCVDGCCVGSYMRKGQHHGPHAARSRGRVVARRALFVQSTPGHERVASWPRVHSVRSCCLSPSHRLQLKLELTCCAGADMNCILRRFGCSTITVAQRSSQCPSTTQ